jgi:hypothetical protein
MDAAMQEKWRLRRQQSIFRGVTAGYGDIAAIKLTNGSAFGDNR